MSPSTTSCHDPGTTGPIRLVGRPPRRSGPASEHAETFRLAAAEQTISRLLIRVRDLPLPSRVRAASEKLGLIRVGDLVQMSPGALLTQRNFGRRSLQMLQRVLALLDLRLGLRVDGWPPSNLNEAESVGEELLRMFIPRKGGTLEDELRQLTAPAGSPRNMLIAVRCLGWDGNGGATLEGAGREHRISKQRASQIVNRVRRQYEYPRVLPPHLVRCLRMATPRLAEDAGAVEERLYRAGETRSPFRLEGLLTAAEILHLPATFEIIRLEGRRVVVRAEAGAFLAAVVGSVIRIADRAGVADIPGLAGTLRNRCSSADFEELLPLHPRFEWLDDARTWFWFRPRLSLRPARVRNRLVNKIFRVISVTGPIPQGDLQSLIRRRRPIAVLPPGEILQEVYRRIPWLRVREGTIVQLEFCDLRLSPR